MLRRWRKKRGLTLREGAEFLGLKSAGALCNIEQGKTFPAIETIVLIEAATGGEVAAEHHVRAWQAANASQFSQLRTAGRAAAKSFSKPAKRRK